jgi:hypothetical protein
VEPVSLAGAVAPYVTAGTVRSKLKAWARASYTLDGQTHLSSWAESDPSDAPEAVDVELTVTLSTAMTTAEMQLRQIPNLNMGAGLSAGSLYNRPSGDFAKNLSGGNPAGIIVSAADTNGGAVSKSVAALCASANWKPNPRIGIDCGPIRKIDETQIVIWAPHPAGQVYQWKGATGGALTAAQITATDTRWNAAQTQIKTAAFMIAAMNAPGHAGFSANGINNVDLYTQAVAPNSGMTIPGGAYKQIGFYRDRDAVRPWSDASTGRGEYQQNARCSTVAPPMPAGNVATPGWDLVKPNGDWNASHWAGSSFIGVWGLLAISAGSPSIGGLRYIIRGIYGGSKEFFRIVQITRGAAVIAAQGTTTPPKTVFQHRTTAGGQLNLPATREGGGFVCTNNGGAPINPGFIKSKTDEKVSSVSFTWTSTVIGFSTIRGAAIQARSGPTAPWRTLVSLAGNSAGVAITGAGGVNRATNIKFTPQAPGTEFRIVPTGEGWKTNKSTSNTAPTMRLTGATWQS